MEYPLTVRYNNIDGEVTETNSKMNTMMLINYVYPGLIKYNNIRRRGTL